MKKLFLVLMVTVFFFGQTVQVNAAGRTIIPEPNESVDCENDVFQNPTKYLFPPKEAGNSQAILVCAVKTGNIHLWMMSYFIAYLAEFLIGLAGILCMFFIVLGGYQLSFGGATEEKERGKKTVIYAIIGLVIVLLSWTIVNAVLYFVTA